MEENLEILIFALILIILFDVFLLYNLFKNTILDDLYNYIAFGANAVGLIGFLLLLNEKKTERVEKEKLRNNYTSRISNLFIDYTNKVYLNDFIKLNTEHVNYIIFQVANETFNSYYLKRDIDTALYDEIIAKFYKLVISLSKPQLSLQLFFKYVYIFNLNNKIDLSGLNESRLRDNKSQENLFIKIMYVWCNFPELNLDDKISKVKNCSEKEINHYIDSLLGIKRIIEKIDQLTQDKYNFLKKIVNKFVSEGYISNRTLRSFLSKEQEIIVVTKNECGISTTLNPEKEAGFNTPFKQALLDEGFIQPSRYMYFTFMKLVDKKDFKKYSDNLELYMTEVIKPKINSYWEKLSKQKEIENAQFNYGYIIYKIDLTNMDWKISEEQFSEEFREKIIGKFDKNQIKELFASQIHRVYFLLKKMDIVSLIDSPITNNQLSILISKINELNKSIKEVLDIRITDCTDYRKIEDINKLGSIISEFMANNDVNIRGDKSNKIAEEIKNNSNNLYLLLDKLGIEI